MQPGNIDIYSSSSTIAADTQYAKLIVERARVARLATIDSEIRPHLVPVVFVFDGIHYYIPLDGKTKKNKPQDLKRVRNILKNPSVALLIDEYDEDWNHLCFVMVSGKASVIDDKGEYRESLKKAQSLLYQKYIQYQTVNIGNSCIKICPEKVTIWRMKKK